MKSRPGAPPPRKATSQDVADLAGVSRSAVSLVLNGRGAGNIAADKQQLIRDAARKLNYQPNAVALSLRNQRTSTIGVVTDWIATTAFAGRLLQGAYDAAAEAGYLLLVIDSQGTMARELAGFEVLQNRQVDGLIFAAQSLREYLPAELLRSGPSALANCFDPELQLPAFVPDEVGGSRSATAHLLDRGHRDLVFLSGTEAAATALREQGFALAMAARGLPTPAPIRCGWDIAAGYAGAMEVLTVNDGIRPTAILCGNDRSATGVLLAAARLGISVPRDLSVVGYDDDENVAQYLTPALTTVRLPHREMGQQAVAAVLDQIQTGGGKHLAPVNSLLECPLVVRDSVAPPNR